jgi:hypothetical protein
MARGVTRVVGLLGLAALSAAAVGVASGDNRPQVDQVAAEITFTHVQGKTRQCEGQDGEYAENRLTFTGTSSGDSRLSGNVELDFHELVNFTQGFGPMQGRIVIRDPGSGRKKADGQLDGTGPLDFVQGVIAGRAHDEGGGDEETTGDGLLVANWRLVYAVTGVTMQLGGETTDGRLPASISSGECKGKWQEIDEPIGPEPTTVDKAAKPVWRRG